MNESQIQRLVAIRTEIEITIDAINDGEIDLFDLDDLIKAHESGSIKHAAYTSVQAIFATN